MNTNTTQQNETNFGSGHGRFVLKKWNHLYKLATRTIFDDAALAALGRLPQVMGANRSSHVSCDLDINPNYSFEELTNAITQLIGDMVERQTGLKQYTRRYVIDPITSSSYTTVDYQANVDSDLIRRLVERLEQDEGVCEVHEYDLKFTVFYHSGYIAAEVRERVVRIVDHTLGNSCDCYLKE